MSQWNFMSVLHWFSKTTYENCQSVSIFKLNKPTLDYYINSITIVRRMEAVWTKAHMCGVWCALIRAWCNDGQWLKAFCGIAVKALSLCWVEEGAGLFLSSMFYWCIVNELLSMCFGSVMVIFKWCTGSKIGLMKGSLPMSKQILNHQWQHSGLVLMCFSLLPEVLFTHSKTL